MKSILDNYQPLSQLISQLSHGSLDSDAAAKLVGIRAKLEDSFLYVLTLSETVYRITDNLSSSLQSSKLTATEARSLANEIVSVLINMRTEENSSNFQEQVDVKAEELGTGHDSYLYQGPIHTRWNADTGIS
ncbi:uncharacterized protein [Watersipora subatra]|uniref:uncharacterized protein n=1 Tax=Watersipora subatra TaxID=2589382 RepID=UPI00355BF9FC